jgi:hypothetical protein
VAGMEGGTAGNRLSVAEQEWQGAQGCSPVSVVVKHAMRRHSNDDNNVIGSLI